MPSSFAFASAPGADLLIQRMLVGAGLLCCVVTTPGRIVAAPQVIGGRAVLLLIAGWWTPAAGVVIACAEAWIAFSSPTHEGDPAALCGMSKDSSDVPPTGSRHLQLAEALNYLLLRNRSGRSKVVSVAAACPFGRVAATTSIADNARFRFFRAFAD
jgi:hypothetical protein